MPATASVPSSEPLPLDRNDRDQVIHWRAALEQGSSGWSAAQRAAFLALVNARPHLVLHGATPASRRTFGRTLGQWGDDAWVMMALDRCPGAAIDLVTGALHGNRVDLAWAMLQDPRAQDAWTVLNDEHLAARWAKNIAYAGGFERFQAWAQHAPTSLDRAMNHHRGRDHLANQAIRQRNTPLLDALLRKGLPLDGDTSAPGRPGSTLAHDLVYSDWDDGLRLLIDRRPGVNLNARNHAGLTPLLHATKYQRWSVVQTLLDAGVDVHATTPDGKQALWYVTAGCKNTTDQAPKALIFGLLVAGADPYRAEGKTNKAGSVDAWMVTNRPKVWQILNVKREMCLLTQAIHEVQEPSEEDALAVTSRPRRRI